MSLGWGFFVSKISFLASAISSFSLKTLKSTHSLSFRAHNVISFYLIQDPSAKNLTVASQEKSIPPIHKVLLFLQIFFSTLQVKSIVH